MDGTMHHSPFRRRWTGGTAAVNGMEERDRVDASTNIVVDPWLSLVGSISALARLTLTDCVILFSYSTVAVTGQKHLLPRPVDFVILFSYSTTAVTGRKHLRPRPVDFIIFIFLLDCGCYWPETSPSSPGRFCHFIFRTRPVAAIGRRHLRPRPVGFIHLC